MSGSSTGRRPKASIQSRIASVSPGVSIEAQRTFTCFLRRPATADFSTITSMMASMASAKPDSRQPEKSGVLTGTTAVAANCGCFSRNSRTRRLMSTPWVSDSPVVGRPITSGAFFSQITRRPSMTLSSALMIEDTWSMAVVCSGIGSRKWRTKKTLPKAVQPCEPWSMGMAFFRPRKASAAPTGWLALSGFTASGLERFRISAIAWLRQSGLPSTTQILCLYITCCFFSARIRLCRNRDIRESRRSGRPFARDRLAHQDTSRPFQTKRDKRSDRG